MKYVLQYLPGLLSALLLWAAFPPVRETPALAFALAPLLAFARLASPRANVRAWFVGGFAFWFATLSWMPAIIKNNGPWPLVVLGWIGLSAYCAFFFAIYGWAVSRLWRTWERARQHGDRIWLFPPTVFKVLTLVVFEPFLWAGLEWVRGNVCMGGFAWNFLGTAAAEIPSLVSPARLGGVYLVSALVLLLNGVFATLVCRVVRQMRREVPDRRRGVQMCETALPLGLILLAFALSGLGTTATEYRPLRVGLVQRNAPCIFSSGTRTENPREVFGRLIDNTAKCADLLVFGESAMAEFGSVSSASAREVAYAFLVRGGAAGLLAGGDYWFREPSTGERRCWNAAALYTTNSIMPQIYGKQHLVPFGEYIPCDKWITALQRLSPIGISLHPGVARTFELSLADGPVKVAPLICFEDTDPVLARRAARLGAQVIVLITNDSWFSNSGEAFQHARQAVVRAVETGLPVVRVGNSGVTGVVSPSGRVRWLEDGNGHALVDAAGTMIERVPVPVQPVLTPYVVLGDLPLIGVFVLSLLVMIPCAFRRGGSVEDSPVGQDMV